MTFKLILKRMGEKKLMNKIYNKNLDNEILCKYKHI